MCNIYIYVSWSCMYIYIYIYLYTYMTLFFLVLRCCIRMHLARFGCKATGVPEVRWFVQQRRLLTSVFGFWVIPRFHDINDSILEISSSFIRRNSFAVCLTPTFCTIGFHCFIFPKEELTQWELFCHFANNHHLYCKPYVCPALPRILANNCLDIHISIIFHLLIMLTLSSIQVIQHKSHTFLSDLKHLDARQNINGSCVCWRTVCTRFRPTLLVKGDSPCRVCRFLLPCSRLVILQGCLESIFSNPGTSILLSRPLPCFSLW